MSIKEVIAMIVSALIGFSGAWLKINISSATMAKDIHRNMEDIKEVKSDLRMMRESLDVIKEKTRNDAIIVSITELNGNLQVFDQKLIGIITEIKNLKSEVMELKKKAS